MNEMGGFSSEDVTAACRAPIQLDSCTTKLDTIAINIKYAAVQYLLVLEQTMLQTCSMLSCRVSLDRDLLVGPVPQTL